MKIPTILTGQMIEPVIHKRIDTLTSTALIKGKFFNA